MSSLNCPLLYALGAPAPPRAEKTAPGKTASRILSSTATNFFIVIVILVRTSTATIGGSALALRSPVRVVARHEPSEAEMDESGVIVTLLAEGDDDHRNTSLTYNKTLRL